MDDTNPDQPNPQGDPETKPSNNAIDQHQVNTHDGAPQDHRPHVAFRNPIVPICGGLVASSRWITEKWGETTFHDKVSIILTSLITLATIAYAIVAGLTLKAINTSSASAGTQNTQLISAAKTQAQAAKTAAPLASISQETPSSHLINPAQIVAEPAIAALRFKSHAMTILLCQGMTSVMPQQHQNQHGFSR